MSFWSANDKIPVQQTKVNIPAEHGLDYTSGQKIDIIIPPTIKYFQPKSSYLRFDVELLNKLDHPVKMTLDGETGAQCLIRDIRIFSGGSGAVLLEEIQNYNVLTALRYDYETNDAIKNKRALTEGSLTYNPTQRSTQGNTKSVYNNTRHNPYHTPYEDANGTAVDNSGNNDWCEALNTNQGGQYNTAKVLLPIHTGIFQSPKVFPSLLTEGLRIEIILEDANKVYRLPDTLHPNRRLNSGLRFHSKTGANADVNATAGMWGQGATQPLAATPVVYLQRENGAINLQNVPFVIGQKVSFYKDNKSFSAQYGGSGSAATKRGKYSQELIIKAMEMEAGAGGLLKITFAHAGSIQNLTGEDINSDWVLCDDSVLDCAITTGTPSNATINLDYKVKNVEMVLQTLTMPQGYTQKLLGMMSSGGAMNYDFLSFTNYKYSQLKGDRVMNMRLPLNQTKAKSVLCIPTDSSVYTAQQVIAGENTTGTYQFPAEDEYPTADAPDNLTYLETIDDCDRGCVSNRSGLTGICDECTDYQFFYNGQLNPSRPVGTDKIARRVGVQQQPLVEGEKALAMAGIQPLSFMKFRENFFIGRALALQQGVYNTAGRDFNLQVNYQGSREPKKNKLWNNYVAHIRRIVVQGDSVVVQI